MRIRSDVDRFPGGDYQQLLRTRDALGSLGVEASVVPGASEVDEPVDVVHLFNTTRIHETAVQFDQARRRGVPVVISPIWHSQGEMKRFYRRLYRVPFFPTAAYFAAKEAWYARRSRLPLYAPAVFRFSGTQRRVLRGAKAVLPNSEVELRILERETGVTPAKTFIIPFGFERPVVEPLPWPERRDIVCAGRIEPRKNQLAVIEAFKSLERTGDRLLLYGTWNESHRAYSRRVREALVPGWVEYGGLLSQADLHAAFGRARAVVLASFFETFGMVALEAIACGANVCLSDTEYTRGFFGDWVQYCDPFSAASVRNSIAAAIRAPARDYAPLLARFSWKEAAQKTLEAYQYAAGT